MSTQSVLLTVPGEIEPDLEEPERSPRPDFLAMAARFGADILGYERARGLTGRFGRVLEKLCGPNVMLAWACFRQRRRYKIVFTYGEQVGIPLALLCRFGGRAGMRHLMLAHVLSVTKKMVFFDVFRLASQIDLFLVYSSWQKRFIEDRWGVQPGRVRLTPFMVDADFYSSHRVTAHPRQMICSAGLEFRDYRTLIEAVRGLDVEVVVAAASPYSKRANSAQGVELPPNVRICELSQYELRQLYANSLFVVVPLYEVNFQAGITVVLEAMAMERAVICSRTSGQADLVQDAYNGIQVAPRDPDALRRAIEHLLENPQLAAEMGANGRRLIDAEMSLDRFADRLGSFVEAAAAS